MTDNKLYLRITLRIVLGLWWIPLRSNHIVTRRYPYDCLFLTFFDEFGKFQILCRLIHAFNKAIVSAAWYKEESTHLANTVFILMAIYDQILYRCFHFLSMSERKFRISSFFISKDFIFASFLTIIYFNSLTLSVCLNLSSLGGLPCLFNPIPAAILRCFLFCRLKKSCVDVY